MTFLAIILGMENEDLIKACQQELTKPMIVQINGVAYSIDASCLIFLGKNTDESRPVVFDPS